jgi:hypothetical protein
MMPTAHGSDPKSCEKLALAPSCRVTHATLMPTRLAAAKMSGNVANEKIVNHGLAVSGAATQGRADCARAR